MSEGASGGCQCGAVRFSVQGALGRATICHCRMCQKAFGSFYGPFVTAPDLVWTRGAPKYFQSSNRVRRGFCADCGTPLTYEAGRGPVEIAIGALDDPAAARPVMQLDLEARLPWLGELDDLPTLGAAEAAKIESFYASIRTFQHPDHDTEAWPPSNP